MTAPLTLLIVEDETPLAEMHAEYIRHIPGFSQILLAGNLAQARMAAGILPGSRVSMAKLPALQERITALRLHGQWIDASIQLTSALGGGYHQTVK